MSGKKPGKSNNPLLNVKQEESIGKPVLYIGLLERRLDCPTCSKKVQKGIVYEHNNIKFCSKRCIVV